MTLTLAEFAMIADITETLNDITHAGDDELLALDDSRARKLQYQQCWPSYSHNNGADRVMAGATTATNRRE